MYKASDRIGLEQGSRVDRRTIWLVSLLGLVAFIIRLLYVFKTHEYDNLGADEMMRAAISYARDGYIGDIFIGSPGRSAHVAPAYPFFLGLIYRIFGWETLNGRIAQCVFASAATAVSIGLVPVIAKKAKLPAASGWLAGILLAFLPFNMWSETSGDWEQPYAALALLGLFWAFCTLRDEQWSNRRRIFLTGSLIGFAVLLSPSLAPAVALMFVSELWTQHGRRKQVFLAGLTMMAVALAMVFPWMVRNYYALGGFVPVRSNFGLELAIGNNPKATGKTFITTPDDPLSPAYQMHPNSSPKERARLAQLGELAYMREKQQMAIQWMKENPVKAVELVFKRFRLFWFPTADVWSNSSQHRLYKSLTFCLIALWMFGELFELLLLRHPNRWLLVAAVIGPSLIYMITHADPRYRYPIFGLSALLACNFILRVGRLFRDLTKTRIVTEAA